MNDDEVISFEDRLYVNPEISSREQDAFIDKFQAIQEQNQAQINQDTYNLGTPVSSNLGGLTGAENLWTTQYRGPAVDAAIANLRQVNLQQLINASMQNQQNAMANRINQAKRRYNRANARSSKGSGNPTSTNPSTTLPEGDVGVEYIQSGTAKDTLTSNAPGTAVVASPGSIVSGGNPTAQVYEVVDGKVTGNLLKEYSAKK